MTQQQTILIIGSGPAGYSAAVYAVRSGYKTILVEGMEPGGQLTTTTDVENYPGFPDVIQGPWLMQQMKQQAINLGVEIVSNHIKSLVKEGKQFVTVDMKKEERRADAVILATGAQAKWLGLESESKFLGYGVSGCATCDAFFFKNKKVMVVGGGNTAVEEALFLTNHAKEVVLVHRRDQLRAEKVLQDRLLNHKQISVLWNSTVEEIIGSEDPLNVTGIKIKTDGEVKEHKVDGIFIAIGHSPNTSLVKDLIELDSEGYITTQPDSTITTCEGLFAAGDVQDKVYRQAITSAGTGCMAALDAHEYLSSVEE